MKTKRCGIYIRCSTKKQTTDLQRAELETYLEKRGWHMVKVYDDAAYSGTNDKRPGLQEMLRDCRSRKIDVVLIYKLDRLFRSLSHLLNTLQEWKEIGVELVSLKDSIDMSSSSGRLLLHLISCFAEFEADLIRSRVNAGLDNARKNGVRLGRPPKLDHAKVLDLRRQGLSMRKIGDEFGVSAAAIHNIIHQNPR
jgi:DNA invertase Pin-like site-specific DNA recombinase